MKAGTSVPNSSSWDRFILFQEEIDQTLSDKVGFFSPAVTKCMFYMHLILRQDISLSLSLLNKCLLPGPCVMLVFHSSPYLSLEVADIQGASKQNNLIEKKIFRKLRDVIYNDKSSLSSLHSKSNILGQT